MADRILQLDRRQLSSFLKAKAEIDAFEALFTYAAETSPDLFDELLQNSATVQSVNARIAGLEQSIASLKSENIQLQMRLETMQSDVAGFKELIVRIVSDIKNNEIRSKQSNEVRLKTIENFLGV